MAINVKKKPHSFSMKRGKAARQIRPEDTRVVFLLRDKGGRLDGIPADSCWLFKAVQGKINGYSVLAEEGYNYLSAMQLGEDGRIVPVTKANLLAMIPEPEEKLKQLIEKDNLLMAIKRYNTN